MKKYMTIAVLVGLMAFTAYSQTEINIDEVWSALPTLDYGDSPTAHRLLEVEILKTYHDEAARKAMIEKLLSYINPESTYACKEFVCRELAYIGKDEVADAMLERLACDEMNHMARFVLELNPSPKADEVLLKALDKAKGTCRIEVINALGARKTKGAVKPLTSLLEDTDSEVSAAAVAALGEIANQDAADALIGADAPYDALVHCAEGLLVSGKKRMARSIYSSLYPERLDTEPVAATAGFVGLAKMSGKKGANMVVEAIKSGQPMLKQAAFGLVISLPVGTKTFCDAVSEVSGEDKVLLVNALGTRGDSAALKTVLAQLDDENDDVRVAALGALSRIGDASIVPPVIALAASGRGAERDTARNTLNTTKGDDVDTALIDALKSDSADERAEAARALRERYALSATPALLVTARDADTAVAKESFKALATLAGPDQLEAIIDIFPTIKSSSVTSEAEKAAVAVAKRIADTESRDIILITGAHELGTKGLQSVLAVMGELGGARLKEAVILFMTRSADDEVRGAAVRALASWPTPDVVPDLLNLAGAVQDEKYRIIVLRGVFRLLASAGELDDATKFAYYKQGLSLSTRPEEKKQAIAGLGTIRLPESKALLESLSGDPAVKAEVKQALFVLNCEPLTVSAEQNGPDAVYAIDNDMSTKWTTGPNKAKGAMFRVGLPPGRKVKKIVVDTTPSPDEYPRLFQAAGSTDGYDILMLGSVKGAPVSVIELPEPMALHSIILLQRDPEQTEPWSIHELDVYFEE